MISNSADTGTVDFLVLEYREMDFLINRAQFSASIYLQESKPLKSPVFYLNSLMDYHAETLIIFDLDRLLKDMFGCRQQGSLEIALISSIDAFSSRNQKIFNKITVRGNEKISAGLIACRMTSMAEIHQVPLSGIRLIPKNIQEKEHQEGILGFRFPREDRVQYFVDLEKLIFNSILRKESLKNESIIG